MDKFLVLKRERESETPSDLDTDTSSNSKTKRKTKNKSILAAKKAKTAIASNEKWRKAHDWLEYCKVDDKIIMFCTWCENAGYSNQIAKGCSTYKKDLIDRHVKNKEHMFLENARNTNQPNIIQSLSQHVSNDKERIINQMKCVYFAAKNHLLLNLYPKLCSLVLDTNKNSENIRHYLLQPPPLSSL